MRMGDLHDHDVLTVVTRGPSRSPTKLGLLRTDGGLSLILAPDLSVGRLDLDNRHRHFIMRCTSRVVLGVTDTARGCKLLTREKRTKRPLGSMSTHNRQTWDSLFARKSRFVRISGPSSAKIRQADAQCLQVQAFPHQCIGAGRFNVGGKLQSTIICL